MKEQIIGLILITLGVIVNNKEVQQIWLKIIRNFMPHDAIIRNQIQSIIEKLQAELGAARVNFWQFNNGTKSEMGYSYKFGSIIYEAHEEHTRSIKKIFKGVPIEDYLVFLKDLQQADKYLITHKNDAPPIIRATYDMIGTQSGIDYKIDNKDVYKGFLSVTFHELPCNRFCKNECNGLCSTLQKIETATAAINNRIKMLKRINN